LINEAGRQNTPKEKNISLGLIFKTFYSLTDYEITKDVKEETRRKNVSKTIFAFLAAL